MSFVLMSVEATYVRPYASGFWRDASGEPVDGRVFFDAGRVRPCMGTDVPAAVEELITGTRTVAHLATAVDDRPHVAPLWYRYEDGIVEIMTTGRKLSNVRKNSRVALSIDEDEDGHPGWMVTLLGTATVVEDEDENQAANRRLNEKYGAEPDAWEENTLVRIDVGSVSYQIS